MELLWLGQAALAKLLILILGNICSCLMEKPCNEVCHFQHEFIQPLSSAGVHTGNNRKWSLKISLMCALDGTRAIQGCIHRFYILHKCCERILLCTVYIALCSSLIYTYIQTQRCRKHFLKVINVYRVIVEYCKAMNFNNL